MIDFVGTPPFLTITLPGLPWKQFSHSPNMCFRTNKSCKLLVQMDNMALMGNCSGGAWWVKLDRGVIVTFIYLYFPRSPKQF